MPDDQTPPVPSHRSSPLFPIPTFQESNVPLWFRQLEHCFHGATEQLPRYHATITAIPFPLLTRIEDELSKAENTTTPYDYIKQAIITATSATPHDRLTAILSQQSLGDKRPTDFLQHLLSLLSPGQATLEDSLIRPLFLQKLPSQAQTVLSTFPLSTPLKDIAAAADRMLQVLPFPDINSVASPSASLPPSTPLPLISAATVPHPSDFRVSHLEKEVRDLRHEITNTDRAAAAAVPIPISISISISLLRTSLSLTATFSFTCSSFTFQQLVLLPPTFPTSGHKMHLSLFLPTGKRTTELVLGNTGSIQSAHSLTAPTPTVFPPSTTS